MLYKIKAKIKYETSSEAWEEAILEKERQLVEHYGNPNMANQVSGFNTVSRKKSLFSKNTVNPTKVNEKNIFIYNILCTMYYPYNWWKKILKIYINLIFLFK